jgi:metal-responsive CopG/Arc/MetJ family transcriptional regulator
MVEAKTMLPKDLLDLVDSLSRAGGVSRSTFLRKMIEAEVDRRTVPESPPA